MWSVQVAQDPLYFFTPTLIAVNLRQPCRNLKESALANEFERNHKSQTEGDRFLKSSGNKMVIYFIALNL